MALVINYVHISPGALGRIIQPGKPRVLEKMGGSSQMTLGGPKKCLLYHQDNKNILSRGIEPRTSGSQETCELINYSPTLFQLSYKRLI